MTFVFVLPVMVLPGERLVRLVHQESQDDMAASIAGAFDGENVLPAF